MDGISFSLFTLATLLIAAELIIVVKSRRSFLLKYLPARDKVRTKPWYKFAVMVSLLFVALASTFWVFPY